LELPPEALDSERIGLCEVAALAAAFLAPGCCRMDADEQADGEFCALLHWEKATLAA